MSKQVASKVHLTIIIITWALVHILLFQLFGIRELFDSQVYIQGADHLIETGSFEGIHHIFYGIHVGIIALSKLIFNGSIIPVIIFQCILSGFATILLYQSTAKLFNNPLAGLFTALIFLCWWDCIHWNITLMTESLFCSLSIILIWVLVHFKRHKSDFVKLGLVFVLLFFTRPTSIVVIIGALTYLLMYYKETIIKWSVQRKAIYLCLLLITGLITATMLFQKWDFSVDYVTGNIISYMDTTKGTSRYNANLHMPLPVQSRESVAKHSLGILNMAHFMYAHPLHIIKTGTIKVFYLLSFYRPYYTVTHNIFNGVWLAAIYGFFIHGFFKPSNHAIKSFTFTIIGMNCLVIAMSTVDWDNRFYIPMEPGIVIFAGLGMANILARFRKSVLSPG